MQEVETGAISPAISRPHIAFFIISPHLMHLSPGQGLFSYASHRVVPALQINVSVIIQTVQKWLVLKISRDSAYTTWFVYRRGCDDRFFFACMHTCYNHVSEHTSSNLPECSSFCLIFIMVFIAHLGLPIMSHISIYLATPPLSPGIW